MVTFTIDFIHALLKWTGWVSASAFMNNDFGCISRETLLEQENGELGFWFHAALLHTIAHANYETVCGA